jgi:hypothetical protein
VQPAGLRSDCMWQSVAANDRRQQQAGGGGRRTGGSFSGGAGFREGETGDCGTPPAFRGDSGGCTAGERASRG